MPLDLNQLPDPIPTRFTDAEDPAPAPQLFTADQVASAVAAAVQASSAGSDPQQAALAALAPSSGQDIPQGG